MPQVLITGGAGFIGSHVADHLLAAGYGYRTGDGRHCFADIGRSHETLGFAPQMAFEEGLEELVAWLADATAIDRVDEAIEELARRGLVA
jgi:nucleoside-diphosphate-sugar epimerase